MRFEKASGRLIPKIGLGTWKIGGGTSADRSHDAESLAALRYALDLGYTHFDTAELYGHGHAEELLGAAIRESGANRQELFITSKAIPEHLTYEGMLAACEASLARLGLDYVDLYLIHWPNPRIPLAESFRALNQIVKQGKARRAGVSNFDLALLKQACDLSETPLLTNQVPYSLGDRSYASNGVVEHCQQHDILVTAYTPLAMGSARTRRAAEAIGRDRGLTARQIALAWLTTQDRVITIPMSANRQHQEENLLAADTVLSAEEMARLA